MKCFSLFACYNIEASMFERRRLIKCFVFVLLPATFVAIVFGYIGSPSPAISYSSQNTLVQTSRQGHLFPIDSQTDYIKDSFTDEDLIRDYDFDTERDQDVLVFLHIQKTGGTTFGRALVRNTDVSSPCVCYKKRKRCDCVNSLGHVWLFSRYSTGWACGLHADWTELNDCVAATLNSREQSWRPRRYLYFTIMRDPVQRYLSEWKHVQRGSTWLAAKLMCDGRQASLREVPFCFQGSDWEGVSLEEFLDCPHNLAHNRQTRMLANLSLIGCYNQSIIPERRERERLMLQSAKDNLRKMAFFGLTEQQEATQYLFEKTFRNGIRFNKRFVQYNETHASKVELSSDLKMKLRQRNRLDIELYRYAEQLFRERLKRSRKSDSVSSSSRALPSGERQSIKFIDGLEAYDDEREDDYDEKRDYESERTSANKIRQRRRAGNGVR